MEHDDSGGKTAHQINNYYTGIISALDVISSGMAGAATEEQKNFLSIAKESAKKLADLALKLARHSAN